MSLFDPGLSPLQDPLDFQALAEVMPQIVWTADPDGGLDYYNGPWFEYTGLTLEETQGWGWAPVLHPDDLQLCLDRWQHAVETGKAYEIEYRFLRAADNTYRWHLGRARPLRNGNGNIIKWIGTCTDIHDQKRALSESAEREQRFRSLVANVPGVVYRCACDADWTMVFISERVEELTGYPAQDFMAPGGRTFAGIIHPDDVERVEEEVNRAVQAGQNYELEYRLQHRSGDVRWVYERGGTAGFAAEGVPWLDGVMVDITARKGAEQERQALLEQVQAERTLLQEVLQQMPNAVWLAEVPSGRLLLGNEGIRQLWGHAFLPAAEIDGYVEYHGFYPDGRPVKPHEWPLARAIETGEVVTEEEIDVLRPDGTLRRASFSAAPIRGPDGRCVAAVVTGTDISERKRAEQAIRDLNNDLERRVERRTRALAESEAALRTFARQLELSNRELQDFAYVASHDLQEPLRKVQAFADRLKSRYAPALGDEGRDYLERMQSAAARMQLLINDLLTLSRVTTRAQPFVPVDLQEITRGVLSDLEVQIERQGAEVRVGALPVVAGDPTQLGQMLQNMIGNALKFRREGVLPVIEVGAEVDGETCRIAVKDNGLGFDEKYLDRIFTPFQRLHGRSAYEGTGMGLTICRKIAERHGGSVTARSLPGEGSTFVVSLPLNPPPSGGTIP
ncbi:PAS domain-containing sensor histidine kinase [Deinococcus hopiensis]|uniref:histidine kinase n=1 Tax=Deinococcus hopiensis KR-140 TaxID=695939 RepID=A0A1W1VPS7_9DEIO|nr:PAS domain-containing protein [Deinococcus hopiensis]SMB94914.1 PAS domain S-box-containing protein [Deinococcus hopiensis KR-140]